MVDSPVESPQSDQDDDDGEYPPDEMETKRIEEVSEAVCNFLSLRSSTFNTQTNVIPVDSSQMGTGRARTKENSPGIRYFLQVFGARRHPDREFDLGRTAQPTTPVGGGRWRWSPSCIT